MLPAGKSLVRFPMKPMDVSFEHHYGPGVDSASKRNEYQESSWGAMAGRHVSAVYLENVGASTSHNLTGLY
jgi:hypothetical protein